MQAFITTIKEDEISPYLVCKTQIIRPLDGTTFHVGDKVKVVFFDKDTPKYAVGQPDVPDNFVYDNQNLSFEDWSGTDVYTTKSPVFKLMSTEEKRTQIRQRTNYLYHGYAQEHNPRYAAQHNKTLIQFPVLQPDPGRDPMQSYYDEVDNQIAFADFFTDSINEGMAQMLRIDVNELRRLNQEKKDQWEAIKRNRNPNAAQPPALAQVLASQPQKPVTTAKPVKKDRFADSDLLDD
jgi:hypothetical protein